VALRGMVACWAYPWEAAMNGVLLEKRLATSAQALWNDSIVGPAHAEMRLGRVVIANGSRTKWHLN